MELHPSARATAPRVPLVTPTRTAHSRRRHDPRARTMSLAMPLAMPLARPLARALAALLAAGTIAACTDTTTAPDESMLDRHAPRGDAAPDARAHTLLAGGAMTVFDVTAGAFENAAPNLSPAALARHESGDDAFSTVFVPAPADVNPGLGPVFMNASCEACHVGDGRGRPPEPGAPFASLLFRVSVSGDGPHGGPSPVPGFGTQLELSAVPGLTPMITASVTYAESTATYGDGSTYSLRVPRYTFQGEYAPLPAVMLVSPRVAPAVFGDGLLEAVPESEILERAGRHDGYDGGQRVSGRANMVWDAVSRRYALGRFGWKANVPTLLQQSAGAYNGDMGVTSSLFPAEPCEGYVTGCDRHAPEVADSTVAATAFYTQTLGVPARRDLDAPQVQEGERVFYEAGCADCHTPTLVTGELPGLPEASNQEIHPYTDLLVHDMGPALADGRPDFGASGSEWRTPPLWGIGLVKVVNGHTMLLHDGRARSLLEAVLWHGGEATHAREHVRHATAKARAALVAFLESL